MDQGVFVGGTAHEILFLNGLKSLNIISNKRTTNTFGNFA